MERRDAVELAGTTKTVGYHEWVDIPNGLVFQSCSDCGMSHQIMVALPDPDAVPAETLRVRFVPESELTQAAREQERLSIPLYRELIRLREEVINLKRELADGNRPTNDTPTDGVRSAKTHDGRGAQALDGTADGATSSQ